MGSKSYQGVTLIRLELWNMGFYKGLPRRVLGGILTFMSAPDLDEGNYNEDSVDNDEGWDVKNVLPLAIGIMVESGVNQKAQPKDNWNSKFRKSPPFLESSI
jgi:hypothetical protein